MHHLKQKSTSFHILKKIQIKNEHLMILSVSFVFSTETYLQRPTSRTIFPGSALNGPLANEQKLLCGLFCFQNLCGVHILDWARIINGILLVRKLCLGPSRLPAAAAASSSDRSPPEPLVGRATCRQLYFQHIRLHVQNSRSYVCPSSAFWLV